MSNSQNASTHGDNGLGFYGENENMIAPVVEVLQDNLGGAPVANPVDVSSHVALNVGLGANFDGSVRREGRSSRQGTHDR